MRRDFKSLCLLSLSARRAWIEIHTILGGFQNVASSLSARRAWIEMSYLPMAALCQVVALRKESVDRNLYRSGCICFSRLVALRKESVDRNVESSITNYIPRRVALRKESVDRNGGLQAALSGGTVALRKESVDRNVIFTGCKAQNLRVALRKESVDRNSICPTRSRPTGGRSPQGERG